ncbi:endonuclease NucS [archaeon]|nr:endonuclease NucS [archaeon]
MEKLNLNPDLIEELEDCYNSKEFESEFIIYNENALIERNNFLKKFDKNFISNMTKEQYYMGLGKKEGVFSYELEHKTQSWGSIRGGSNYKFGYYEDFLRVRSLILKIISLKDDLNIFYKKDGNLTEVSKEIIRDSNKLKGVGRALIGKILCIFFPETFIPLYSHQDKFLNLLYDNYSSNNYGVELFLRNNYKLILAKNKIEDRCNNLKFEKLLYYYIDKESRVEKKVLGNNCERKDIDLLEVQHFQTLVSRNFNIYFEDLNYFDKEYQENNYGHFDTQEVGIMDFLAIDKKGDFVVIELKVGKNTHDSSLGQILRYMGWVKERLCKDNQKVRGIILGQNIDNKLQFGLKMLPEVSFKKAIFKLELEDVKN